MKKFLLFIILLLPMMALAQSKYIIIGNKVNVRSAPSTKNSKIVGSLSSGKTITVKDIKNGWAAINYQGKTCYVNAGYLQPVEQNRQESRNTTTSANYSHQNYNYKSQSPSYNEQKRGFAMSSDIAVGYSKKTLSTMIGFDAGYRFNKMLYIGAGPMIEGDFSDGGSAFAVGGYGKVRFTVPLESSIKPMIGARIGYIYNLTVSSGDLFYGGELGINFSKRFYGGIMVSVTSNTTRTVTKGGYASGSGTMKDKYYRLKDKVSEDTEYFFTPALFFSIDF